MDAWFAQDHTEPWLLAGGGCSHMTHQVSVMTSPWFSVIGTTSSLSWTHQQGSTDCVPSEAILSLPFPHFLLVLFNSEP